MDRILKIGSRGSPLALKQVEMVQEALAEVSPALETEVVIIETSGDWKPSDGEVLLSEADGGKAQFAKEIEEALLAGEVDCAVHSIKDMDSFLPDGLVIDHMLPREDARDCLLFSSDLADNSRLDSGEREDPGFRRDDICVGEDPAVEPQDDSLGRLSAIPDGAVAGTASVRRAAFLLAKRPDLKIEPFRGNVQTRIGKLRVGQVDVTMLAAAGLKRLGIFDEADAVLSVDEMLPAAAQGAIGIELRAGDEELANVFSQISHEKTVLCVKAERAVLKALDGNCHSPIGAYAVLESETMWIRVCVASVDGGQVFEDEIRGSVGTVEEAQLLGEEIGARMKLVIPEGIL